MAIRAFVHVYFVKLFWPLFSCNPFMPYWRSSFATSGVKTVCVAFKVLVCRVAYSHCGTCAIPCAVLQSLFVAFQPFSVLLSYLFEFCFQVLVFFFQRVNGLQQLIVCWCHSGRRVRLDAKVQNTFGHRKLECFGLRAKQVPKL